MLSQVFTPPEKRKSTAAKAKTMFDIFMTFLSSILRRVLPDKHLQGNNQGKAVFITGCDSGFGFETAKLLDSQGFQVFAGCLNVSGPGARRLIEESSPLMSVVQLDLRDPGQLREARETVEALLGQRKLWGLVNNAGVCYLGQTEVMAWGDMCQVIDVNLKGTMLATKTFLPLIRRAKGRIVNVGSVNGEVPMPNFGVYNCSKAAVKSFTETLRYELQRWGVEVSLITPAGFKTGIMSTNLSVCQRWWDEADIVVKEDYGREFFNMRMRASERIKVSGDLSLVCDAIQSALLSTNPQPVYRVGQGSRILPALCNYTPTAFKDWLCTTALDFCPETPAMLSRPPTITEDCGTGEDCGTDEDCGACGDCGIGEEGSNASVTPGLCDVPIAFPTVEMVEIGALVSDNGNTSTSGNQLIKDTNMVGNGSAGLSSHCTMPDTPVISTAGAIQESRVLVDQTAIVQSSEVSDIRSKFSGSRPKVSASRSADEDNNNATDKKAFPENRKPSGEDSVILSINHEEHISAMKIHTATTRTLPLETRSSAGNTWSERNGSRDPCTVDIPPTTHDIDTTRYGASTDRNGEFTQQRRFSCHGTQQVLKTKIRHSSESCRSSQRAQFFEYNGQEYKLTMESTREDGGHKATMTGSRSVNRRATVPALPFPDIVNMFMSSEHSFRKEVAMRYHTRSNSTNSMALKRLSSAVS